MTKTVIRTAILVALTGVCSAWVDARSAADTSQTPVLIELPSADRLLESLDEKQPFSGVGLIVLSEHVDYWNDGWIDPYSSKLFTSRQQAYAERLKIDETCTPQMVIDGARQTVGANAAGIQKAVEAACSRDEQV